MPDMPNALTTALPGDPFFILKDCRGLFVQRLTELARQSGIRDPAILEAMGREIGDAHDELAASPERHSGFDETQGLTASRISLVGNDDLELDIRIGEIANQLKDNKSIDHWHAQRHYMTLLQRYHMTPDENPVGMEPIRRGMQILCRESEGDLDQHLGRLQRLEELLKLRLPEIYLEIRQLLDQRGIKPTSVQPVRQTGKDAPSADSSPAASGEGSAPCPPGFRDLGLPEAIRTILGRLQLSLQKKVILDPDFPDDMKQLAKQLGNRLAQAAVGLPPDTPDDHPLCRSLSDLANTVWTALETGDGDLAPALARLDALIARRDETTRTAAMAYAKLVQDHEHNESVLASAEDWLQKMLTRTREPAVAHFLSTHWVRVMRDAGLAGGIGGDAWKEGESVVNHLLWSIRPKRTPEERQKLIALIPALVRKINAGLDRIAVPAEQRKPFLDACFALQTGALHGKSSGGALPPYTPNAMPVSRADVFPPARILESEGKRVQYFGRIFPSAVPQRDGPAVTPGDWLSFRMPDGGSPCGMVCWQGEDSRTLLLLNPAWSGAIALAPQIVEQQLRAGTARVVSSLSLFDTAVE